MYIRIEDDAVVRGRDIVGIFDMDNTTVSRLGRNFLPSAEKNGLIINTTDDLPKSFVVTNARSATEVLISSVSSKILANRSK